MSRISYSLATAADDTGLSASHLKRAIAEGLLKAKRSSVDGDDNPTGKYVILAADLEAYVRGLVDA